jgi:response regulator of citrate/malate metabolism|tara:strand:+ start:557 stop:808 length:252 start_codon:yes stop_codon:yes gene_type:complete
MTHRCPTCGKPLYVKSGLSKGQKKFYDKLKNVLKDLQYTPSYEELANRLEMSKTNVFRYMTHLESKGWVQKDHNHKCSFSLVD